MAFITTTFKLDLTPGASRQVIHASQGDIGRPFEADLYWNGSPWTATGTTASIRGKKPDDTVFNYGEDSDAEVTIDGSKVTFSTTEQMTIISGPVECELVFSNDGDVIASANFVLMVEGSPFDPNAISESEVQGINAMIQAATPEAVDDWFETEAPTSTEFAAAMQNATDTYLDENGVVINYSDIVGAPNVERLQNEQTLETALTWERGGVDNENGNNNNNGSPNRSRTVTGEYFKATDVYTIVNGTSYNSFAIIYTKSGDTYTFSTMMGIAAGETRTLVNYAPNRYVRFDLRGGLEYTKDYKVYSENYAPLAADVLNHKGIIEANGETVSTTWEQGTIGDSDGRPYASPSRIRTGFIEVKKGQVFTATSEPGEILQVYRYDTNEICKGYSAQTTGYYYKAEQNEKVRVLLHRRYGEAIDTSESAYVTLKIYTFCEEVGDTATIPTYWESAIETAETQIKTALEADEKSSSFGFVTDTHIGVNKGYSGLLMEKVLKDCYIPVWFHGGDAVSGAGVISKENLIAQMNADFAQFAPIENIGLRAIGNHDPAFGITNNYDSNLNNGEINLYYHGVDREKYLQVYGDGKGYFYKDIHKDKLRCIVLDIIPYESQVNADDLVTGVNKMYYHQFGAEQLNWFIDVLANTPENYSVVVCSHIAPVSLGELQTLDNSWSETCPVDYLQARKIAEAYKLKTTYAFDGTVSGDQFGVNYNISADFTNAHGDFVCFFCGHTHKDFNLTLDNVLIVGTANDSFAVSTNATAYAPAKTAETDTEHVLDFFCIQPTNNTLKVVRLGAYLASNGKVRTFAY